MNCSRCPALAGAGGHRGGRSPGRVGGGAPSFLGILERGSLRYCSPSVWVYKNQAETVYRPHFLTRENFRASLLFHADVLWLSYNKALRNVTKPKGVTHLCVSFTNGKWCKLWRFCHHGLSEEQRPQIRKRGLSD